MEESGVEWTKYDISLFGYFVTEERNFVIPSKSEDIKNNVK